MNEFEINKVPQESGKNPRKKLVLISAVAIFLVVMGVLFAWYINRGEKVSPMRVPGTFSRSEIIEGQKAVAGVVKNIVDANNSNKGLVMEVELLDLSDEKMIVVDPTEIRKIVKEITVNVTPGTPIQGKEFEEIIQGDYLRVLLDSSPYRSSTVVAKEIIYIDIQAQKKASIEGNQNELFGKVAAFKETVNEKIFTINARVVDVTKTSELLDKDSFVVPYMEKTYTVRMSLSTKIIGKEGGRILVGDGIRFKVEENIYENSTLTAREAMYVGNL